jgi:ubiquinone biosynthesis protein
MAVPRRTARLRRYHEIARTLGRYGFDWLLMECGLSQLVGRDKRWLGRPRGKRHTQPQRLRLALEELGATFVKFGQLLSTRPGLLPPEYTAELSKLQDSTPPEPYSTIAAVIRRELGKPPQELFESFEVQPLAAASIGQVHAAQLPDGTPVVVKVQRPGVQAQSEVDLTILREIAHLVSQRTWLRDRYDLEGWVEEFALALRGELDYLREGRNAERIRRNCAGNPALYIPRIYWEYSTRRVLTMEEIHGINTRDVEALKAAGVDCRHVAETCARIALVQIVEHGFFHADPHPGNFFVMPDGAIGLIDFGMVGHLDHSARESLFWLGLAVIRKDADRVVDELQALRFIEGRIRREALKRDLEHLILQYSDQPVGSTYTSHAVHELVATAARHRLHIPSDLALLARVMVMCEGLGASLDPKFTLMEVAQPYLDDLWRQARSPEAIVRRFLEGTEELVAIGSGLPKRLRRILGQLERGEITITTRLEEHDQLLQQLQRAADQVAKSILASGLLITFSILVFVYRQFADNELGALLGRAVSGGRFGYQIIMGAAVTLAVGLLALFLRKGRR